MKILVSVFHGRQQEFYSSLLFIGYPGLSYLPVKADMNMSSRMFLLSLSIHIDRKLWIFLLFRAGTSHIGQSMLKRRNRLACWLRKENALTQPLELATIGQWFELPLVVSVSIEPDDNLYLICNGHKIYHFYLLYINIYDCVTQGGKSIQIRVNFVAVWV